MLTRPLNRASAVESWRLQEHEKPLRAEAFSEDHLAEHSRQLAEILKSNLSDREDPRFLNRFFENAEFLRDAIKVIAASSHEGLTLRPDAEWLLDNFYIVDEQLREIRDDLPRRYYRELPKTTQGEPRVYHLAVELVTHTDSVLDEETIVRFVNEFQAITALVMGEIWAIPIMLRLVLTENLRRIAAQMLSGHASERKASQIVGEWPEGSTCPIDLSPVHECGSLIFHLIDKLQQDGAANLERIRELERSLAAHDLTIQESVHIEHQRQASSQVSIGNVITSMRLISTVDWIAFFERTNLSEQVLRQDPAGVYPRMDFESRDRYRHVVEDLADGCRLSETEVAKTVVRCAQESSVSSGRAFHIGYWLFDEGRKRLEAKLGFQAKMKLWPTRFMLEHPNLTYLGSVGLVTIVSILLMEKYLFQLGTPLNWMIIVAGLSVLPASELAVGLVNALVTSWIQPRLLSKLDFSLGIPADHQTVVVVPCMLSRPAEVDSLLQRLEMHFLANSDPALSFALLTDFEDAPDQQMPHDEDLIQQAILGIKELNAKHGTRDEEPFYLFHRERRWNPQEKVWMGWERKRGKLMEFNRLLRGRTDTSFVVKEGRIQRILPWNDGSRIRYVITLDADTALPHGAARRLIATIAHPLNVAVFDESSHRVVSGYVLLQPRVTANLASAEKSRFARTFANNPGLDPYSTCASDVYQDLFGEGSFTGKGIYEIEGFEKALEDAFPENQILSHDLIEGCHTRVALVSDIELFDNFPLQYEADAKRQHRWVRGDWQISPWLLPTVPYAHGWRENRLSLVSRWKILDNLRRSLVAPSLMLLLVTGWLGLPQLSAWFTGLGLLCFFSSTLTQFGLDLCHWPRNVSFIDQAKVLGSDFIRSAMQALLTMAFLPYKAWSMTDAVVRTWVRVLWTRHKLLEWATASEVERRLATKSGLTFIHWAIVPVLTMAVAYLLDSTAVFNAAPFLGAWFIAPLLLYWMGLPPRLRETSPLKDFARHRLRLDARRIWGFFEAYVGPRDHWLPPDNVQEYPEEKIAHRISPTNEGLFLVSGLVARDFGYISLHSLVDLWESNLSQWTQFERLQGHFFNWYDTVALVPLAPRYVSTVDSGNLIACLMTLQKGIEDLRRNPLVGPFLVDGMSDTVEMIIQTGERARLSEDRLARTPWLRFRDSLTRLQLSEFSFSESPHKLQATLERWHLLRSEIASNLEPLAISLHGAHQEVLSQARILLEYLATVHQEVLTICPWLPAILDVVHAKNPLGGKTSPFEGLISAETFDAAFGRLVKILMDAKTLAEIQNIAAGTSPALDELRRQFKQASIAGQAQFSMDWIERVDAGIRAAANAAESLDQRLQSLWNQIEQLVVTTDFRILFDPKRKLFSIGYNLESSRLDGSYYDMLCSEARIASFLAIAKGDVESRHWFRLGRQMTQTAGELSLLSWGGTMFEFLMPHLFQKTYENSLLMRSCRTAVRRQQEYGRQKGVPWGISECAFGALASNSDYHYRSFGVPGLGLKRGLSKDLVISPYSTMLALEFDPRGAVDNLGRIRRDGGLGAWGFYESLDYTPERVPAGKRSIVVRSYMAHHQGMSLLAIGNALLEGNTRRRFHDCAIVRATELLLQERTPLTSPKFEPHGDEQSLEPRAHVEEDMVSRRISGVTTAAPRIQLLSNGKYHVMVTSTGGGYSQCGALSVTRWRSDATRDHWGQFLYLRDIDSNHIWSATYQPTCVVPARYEAVYSIDKAEFFRRDGQFETHLEIAVSPENNAEIRELTITNSGGDPRPVEITSYAEISLIEMAADISHCAFQKLFIETEYVAEKAALLAKRRPRDSRQQDLWAVHSLSASAEVMATLQYETSRQVFLGRGRTPQQPAAFDEGGELTGTIGAVLDPIFSLRCIVTVPAGESVSVAFITSMAASRDEAIALADQYHDPRGVQRAFELAWAYCQVELRHIHVPATKMHQYQRLASAMLYPDRARRPATERLRENRLGQRGLWRYGISGTLPILLVSASKPEQIDLVRESLGAHLYWKGRGLKTDLVIVNDSPGSYLDEMHEQLVELLQEMQIRLDEQPASVFLLRSAQIPAEDKILLEAVASAALFGERGSFSRQVEAGVSIPAERPNPSSGKPAFKVALAKILPSRSSSEASDLRHKPKSPLFVTNATEDLEFWNGIGGFAKDGREYHVQIRQDQATPMPWSNIIANPRFGCLVTESGGGYTWFGNSRENKLTTWANDPVSDTSSENLYIFDSDSGELFSPFAAMKRDGQDYWAQHGQGYSRFIHRSNDLAQHVLISIAADDPVKLIVLTLRNERWQFRRLSLTYYAEWVLGVCREETQMHVVTSVDEKTGALLATNSYHPETPAQVSFLHVLHRDRTVTGDRTEGDTVTGILNTIGYKMPFNCKL